MVSVNYTTTNAKSPGPYADLQQILVSLDDAALLERLQAYRLTGRPGWPLKALWYAYAASYCLDMDSTNALIRRLEDDPALRELCGFTDGRLPHRTTFNRFVARLREHPELVEQVINSITTTLHDVLPLFATEIAIDSTDVYSYANPHRKDKVTGECSDPEAAWGVKHLARSKAKDNIEWYYGYKLHMISDANYDLPVAWKVTPANRSDSPELRAMMDKAYQTFDWFRPRTAMADRGYDALVNFQYLYLNHGVDPVIHIRRPGRKDELYDELFNADYLPECLGGVAMEYAGVAEDGKYIFQCRSEGCHLKEGLNAGIRHCDIRFAEDPADHLRVLGGRTRRGSPEWDETYSKRWSVERGFKGLKESCRLDQHYIRGRKAITLHCLMSLLTYQSRALVKLLAGGLEELRWTVRKVA